MIQKTINWFDLGALLDDIALNAAAATRTVTIGPTLVTPSLGSPLYLLDFATLILRCTFTHAATGAITFAITEGSASSANTHIICADTISSGATTLDTSVSITTASLSGSTNFTLRKDIAGFEALTIEVDHGGTATANDKFTMEGMVTTVPLTYSRA